MLVGLKVQRPEALTWPQWRLLKSTEKKKIFAHLKENHCLNFTHQFGFLSKRIKSSLAGERKVRNWSILRTEFLFFFFFTESEKSRDLLSAINGQFNVRRIFVYVCRHSLMKRNQAIRAFQMAFAQSKNM